MMPRREVGWKFGAHHQHFFVVGKGSVLLELLDGGPEVAG